jgi:hypothetical protein
VADIGAVDETAHKPRELPIISPPAFALPDEPETSIALGPAGKGDTTLAICPHSVMGEVRRDGRAGGSGLWRDRRLQHILPYVTDDESLPILRLS